MTIKADNLMEIKDVNIFITNITNMALSGSLYNSGNVPKFTKTTTYNTGYGNNWSATCLSQPEAVPSADLTNAAKVKPTTTAIQNKDEVIKGKVVYDTLVNIVQQLTCIRNFNSKWYHRSGGSTSLIETVTGKAIFASSLSTLPTYEQADSAKRYGWTRSVNSSLQEVEVNNPLTTDTICTATDINKFYNDLSNAWNAATKNTIEYNLYSCHYNCHDNCYNNRSRR